MSDHTIYTRLSADEVGNILALIPGMIAGEGADPLGIGRGIRLRVGVKLLSLVKQAFVEKSRGGMGSDGIVWAPLTKAYLAYGRRFGKGEAAGLKKAAGLGKGNNRRGLLTAAQNKRWKALYAQALKWLGAQYSLGEAKAKAAAIAWAKLRAEGARTKLDVFGSRRVEMLRDTGVLFNSLSPGIVTESGPSANYSPPANQIFYVGANNVIVGTSVRYAGAQHKRRPLWPEPENWPAAWWDALEETAEAGVVKAIIYLLTR